MYFWPHIKATLPHTSELVVTFLNWEGNKLLLGLSAGAFLTPGALFCSLVGDARRALYPPRTESTPQALEAGLKSSPAADAEVQNAVDPAAIDFDIPPPALTIRLAGKVVALLACSACFAADLWLREIVSREATILVNARAAAMHLLSGAELLFVLPMLLLAFMVWKSRRGSAASWWAGTLLPERDLELEAEEDNLLFEGDELDAGVKPVDENDIGMNKEAKFLEEETARWYNERVLYFHH
ncbi:hypothetical protein B0H19DRAFT_1065706 [Mycena capillaripes]|nr:hypothetical protein B0H19DRAFT_1065706 [Mycena capillaripes]